MEIGSLSTRQSMPPTNSRSIFLPPSSQLLHCKPFGQEEEEDGSFDQGSKRRRTLFNAVRQVMTGQSLQCLLLELEPFLRRVVQEEVQNVLLRHVQSASRLPTNLVEAVVTRRYQLHFKNRLPQTLFTGSRVETEGKAPVQIVLLDTDSKKNVTSGPLSSTKIEIIVLSGDFGGDGQEDWSEKEFDDNIVREREGKRPLLIGDLVITLNEGIGYLGDLSFTDNSSWIRSRKFRLGARVSQSICTEGVQEAISEAFFVKDHRGELYRKHHPPSLGDDVWRLEKIGKEGAFHRRLADNGINTVQDFLKLLVMDQDRLRNLLGSGMPEKVWEATLEHARECVLDDKLYSYYIAGQGVRLVFDCIFQLVGASFDGHVYHPLDDFTTSQKVLVNNLKQLAYRNPYDVVEFDEPLVDSLRRPLPTVDATSILGSSLLDPRILHLPATCQDEPATQVGFRHLPNAPFSEFSEDLSQLKDISTWPGFNPLQQFASFQPSSFNIKNFIDEQFLTGDCSTEYTPEVEIGSSSSLAYLWGHGNGMFQAPGGEISGDCSFRLPSLGANISPSKWVRLMAALKCVKSIRKRLAARRARVVHMGYQTLPFGTSEAHGREW